MPKPPSAAAALYPHLRQGTPNEVERRRAPNSIGEAMWPSLSREAKAHDAAQARWDEWRKRERDSLLRHLRDANARIDERLRREGRR
jgi:hypothetical protein